MKTSEAERMAANAKKFLKRVKELKELEEKDLKWLRDGARQTLKDIESVESAMRLGLLGR
jgi:hypothetical protein